ncbi:MAG TPA: hypothetical protein VNV66_16125 [Pilimelia sp.]|nr:hypothetical protein [Pilimelia sp.]
MTKLRIDLWYPALDAEQLDEVTTSLRLELADAGISSTPAADDEPPPAGARAVDPAAIGALVVAVTAGVTLLRETLTLVREWRTRRPGVSVRLKFGDREVELTGTSAETEARLVEAFLAESERD